MRAKPINLINNKYNRDNITPKLIIIDYYFYI